MSTPETRIIGSDAGDVEAYIVTPEGAGPFPGLLLIEEIWGVNDHIKDVCSRYAAEGFLVLSPELIDKSILAKISPDISRDMWSDDDEKKHAAQAKMREAIGPVFSPDFAGNAMKKLAACIDAMFADKRLNGNLGVMGFCFGGTYTFQLAIHDRRIKAAVPFYGQVPEPVDDVEKITCPILNFNGAHDENIMKKLPDLITAMQKYDRDYTPVTYPDAGHAFFNDTNKRAYNEADAKDAWEKSLAFLKKNLA